ncbi:MAG: energy-coupling factor transporter transmembrane protein EcfT [Thermomicrobiales bacterium]|nr:energy-coupling factor transporter transmembrane protein EcfT [Thermomicrobiales bacterium]
MSRRLDPRTWIVWWVASSLPALVGRNPVPLITVLVAIALVRAVVQPDNQIVSPVIIRLFLILAGISVLFNILTVHAGNIVLFTLPDRLPLIGGEVTLNAVVYGFLSALAILTLILAGLTVAEQIAWPQVMRMLPDALLGFGAAGSIALAFFPQMIASFREIREARLIRGAPLIGLRDYATIVAPMLALGLDRAVTLSELLEVRAFGGSAAQRVPATRRWVLPAAVTALLVAAYLFLTASTMQAALVGAVGMAMLVWTVFADRSTSSGRTRYQRLTWTRSDSVVASASAVAIAVIAWTLATHPDALRYEPYPDLTWPAARIPLVAGLCLVASPAIVTLYGEGDHA